ncbi:MAG: Lrp/AsnC family transcriptional regulator [Rhodospirillales bacterium]
MDAFDARILALLQENAAMPVADIAAAVGLSTTPCWRRIRNMEESGVIRRRVAVLDPVKINAGVTVFVGVKAGRHAADWLDTFAAAVQEIEEVTEVYRLSGEIDYMLKVVVPDIAAYDDVYKRLIARADFADVSSFFAMEEIKATTALPLKYLR